MRRPKNLSGDLVYEVLRTHPGIATKSDIALAAGLSVNQVAAGIVYVKEVAAYEHKTPFTWSFHDGYHLNPDFDMCRAYERHTSFGNYTRIKRDLMGTYAPHAALNPRDPWLHKMTVIYETFLDNVAAQLDLQPLSWPLPLEDETEKHESGHNDEETDKSRIELG